MLKSTGLQTRSSIEKTAETLKRRCEINDSMTGRMTTPIQNEVSADAIRT